MLPLPLLASLAARAREGAANVARPACQTRRAHARDQRRCAGRARASVRIPADVTISLRLTTFLWRSTFRILISLMAVIGNCTRARERQGGAGVAHGDQAAEHDSADAPRAADARARRGGPRAACSAQRTPSFSWSFVIRIFFRATSSWVILSLALYTWLCSACGRSEGRVGGTQWSIC